ncbi:MAG: glutathione S-transferase family protein [Synechococcales cyanobacterium]
MLTLYYARPSAYARPVWLALLEKQVPFQLVAVDLSGEQFQPPFRAVNPFSHVPVLVDGSVRVIESLAILDYLEARYPTPSFLPQGAEALATVRMVQLLTFNELLPGIISLLMHDEERTAPDLDWHYAQNRIQTTLAYWEPMLAGSLYFAGDQLTLAEIVAGTLVHRLPDVGIPLTDFPHLAAWSDRLLTRPTWQQIALSPEEWHQFKRRMKVMPKVWARRRRSVLRVAVPS